MTTNSTSPISSSRPVLWWHRDPGADGVGVAFTSGALDLADASASRAAGVATLADEVGVPIALVRQVHGRAVVRVGAADARGGLIDLTAQEADAVVTTERGVGVAVRVADCVPVVLADAAAGVVAAAHAGRPGLLCGVVDATVDAMLDAGAADLTAWLGPHVCGSCYEVPLEMAADAAGRLGIPRATTAWGTPAIDLTAAAVAQLEGRGVRVDTAAVACTRERADLHSYRRDGAASGRLAGLGWLARG